MERAFALKATHCDRMHLLHSERKRCKANVICCGLRFSSLWLHTLPAQSWEQSKWENPLYGKTYDQFVLKLEGSYLTPPNNPGPTNVPRLVIPSANGKFSRGEFMLGAVVQPSGTKSLKRGYH
jgi:hypothetical protein